ncbi:MAG: hypothetical protein WA971_04150 [Microbacterium sp.]
MPAPAIALRLTALAGATLLTLGALAGCSPESEPTPAPRPVFASEEEAFNAAEETYLAYTEATNSTDLSDPSTFEEVFDWMIDPAEGSSRKNYSAYHAEGISRTGETTFDTFTPVSFKNNVVTIRLCVDVSQVQLHNGGGESVTPVDRPPRQALELELVPGKSPTSLVIRSSVRSKDLRC